jgi:hypothetical protein
MLLKKYAPLARLHHDEQFLPTSVPWFVTRCTLEQKTPDKKTKMLLSKITDPEIIGNYPDTQAGYFLNAGKNTATYRGEFQPDSKKIIHAPCYATLVEKTGERNKKTGGVVPFEEGAVLQYWFFYAFNGPTVGPMVDAVAQGIGTHEGDWEHIDVHLIKDAKAQDGYRIKEIWYAFHRSRYTGSYATPRDISFDGTHPIVYIAQNGHASHEKSDTNWENLDFMSTKGPSWPCWENLVDIGSQSNPAPGQKWVRFGGTWGYDGPTGPEWRETDYQEIPVLTIKAQTAPIEKKRNSEYFSFVGKIPTRSRYLCWYVNEILPGQTNYRDKIRFNVRERKLFSFEDPIIMTIQSSSQYPTCVPVPRDRNKLSELYISDVVVQGGGYSGAFTIRLVALEE